MNIRQSQRVVTLINVPKIAISCPPDDYNPSRLRRIRSSVSVRRLTS